MIKIENLTKVYKSKNKEKCVAINDISLTIEDNGFVFIIGKSGSGKTTLLGLIGGLDNITSGNIIINGNSFKNFKFNDYTNFRNQMIGYVFQDFHLIDELTIEENIALSLDLQNIKYTDEINNALASVDLAGYNLRYPRELSGGEKQRVAIARALVKNPKIILADEPTGNLDSKTTTQILELLKKLSKDRLVLMVSHSLSDANMYADRIIELSHGKIINDYIRNPDYCYNYQIKNNQLILPLNKKITNDEILVINENLQNGNIKAIFQTDDVFIPNTTSYEVSEEKTNLKGNRFNCIKLFKLAFIFLKKDFIKLFIYSFVVAALIVILGLSQLIVNFNSAEVIKNELSNINQSTISFTKKDTLNEEILIVDETKIMNIDDSDISSFYESGYDGNIYELVNVFLDYGPYSTLAHLHTVNQLIPNAKYHSGTKGTLITDEEYVESLFGEINYIALADEIKDYGIYITDYSADAIIYYSPQYFSDYNSILGKHKSMGNSYYAYVNGIIETGYKEKHQEVMSKLDDVEMSPDEIQALTQTEEYLAFYDDVVQNYAIAFSFNPNFKEDFIESNSCTWTPMGNSTLTYNNIPFPCDGIWFQLYSQENKYDFKDNEIVLLYSAYNEIFGTNYNTQSMSTFIPHKATFTYYYYFDKMRMYVVDSFEVEIIAISNDRSYAAEEAFERVQSLNTYTNSLYFNNQEEIEIIFNTANELGYEPNSIVAYSLATMTKAVNIFSEFFVIIFVGLCVCSFIILINYGIKLVKERKYEIGILKALGIKEFDLFIIIGLQMILLILLVIAMYILGSILFIDLSNDILVRSLLELAPNHFLMDIDVLYLKTNYILENSLLVILIVSLSFVIPLFKLKFLKPTNIIKAKE